MKKNSGLHVLFKQLGETPNETILRFKKDHPEYVKGSMTYAGRLDPLAEGVLLVLSGEAIKEKEKYQNLSKTYEVEILWGFGTDSLDVLGAVTGVNKSVPEIEKYLKNSLGNFVQKYPIYSSKTVNGVPLWQLAREGKLDGVEIPSHRVEVLEGKFLGRKEVSGQDLLEQIQGKTSKVNGDFRQEEVLSIWKSKIDLDRVYTIDRISLSVSSGFYVRQFVSDMAENFKTSATTFYIKRIKVGDYDLENCE